MKLLQNTKRLVEVEGEIFDCLYLTSGHGTMFDFTDDEILQKILRQHDENRKIVCAICHGVGGLLNVKLSNRSF